MMNKQAHRGFTLPELLMATALSVMAFFALGTLLSRSFSVWHDGMEQWKLATHARVTRVRLLDGGFGKGSGLLSATNHTLHVIDGRKEIKYYPATAGGNPNYSYGWMASDADGDVVLYDPLSSPERVYGQSLKVYDPGGNEPDVRVGGFDAEFMDGNVLQLIYRLRSTVRGRTFEQLQTVRVVLPNSN